MKIFSLNPDCEARLYRMMKRKKKIWIISGCFNHRLIFGPLNLKVEMVIKLA